ncbi:MAG TPA: hypothetical protein VKJ00_08355 [Thermoanaerobaculia bacterium]|nr:hypothetical protein [Thermoanaerobaculia bacterium]
MAKKTRKAVEKLPVESVSARKAEEVRGGAPKGTSSTGKTHKYMEFQLKEVFVSGVV